MFNRDETMFAIYGKYVEKGCIKVIVISPLESIVFDLKGLLGPLDAFLNGVHYWHCYISP